MSSYYKEFGEGNIFISKTNRIEILRIHYPELSYYQRNDLTKVEFDDMTTIEFTYNDKDQTKPQIRLFSELPIIKFKEYLKKEKVKLKPQIRTLEGWEESNENLDDYVMLNDYIDEDLVMRQVEIVDGGYLNENYAQCGEAADDYNGYLVFDTYKKVKNTEYWKYIGVKYSKRGKRWGL